MDISAYLDALASDAATPGGGSAAALVGATGAALVAMVARITLASPKHAEVHAAAASLIEDADAVRSALLADREADEEAYGAVVSVMALPRTTPEEKAARTERMQAALAHAAAVPLQTAHRGREVLTLARRALDLKNDHLVSDVGCAAEFAAAAIRACAYNVRINHKFLKDQALIAAQSSDLQALEQHAATQLEHIRSGIRLGGSIAR